MTCLPLGLLSWWGEENITGFQVSVPYFFFYHPPNREAPANPELGRLGGA